MISDLSWQKAITMLSQSHQRWALATVLGTRGSSPRDAGTKMVITPEAIYDTIGGGQFEFCVIEQARQLLQDDSTCAHQEICHFPLAAKTKQCCGGTVSVLIETFKSKATQIDVFGAGHVAHALIPILANMDVHINWVDNRDALFPDPQTRAANVRCIHVADPVAHCANMKSSSIALVLTHDHTLDYRLVCALLDRKDTLFLGLIGSKTKSMRFRQRLKSESFTAPEINHVCCPVGLASIPGKQPIEIAISMAAQIVQILHTQQPTRTHSGLSWRKINDELKQTTLARSEEKIIL